MLTAILSPTNRVSLTYISRGTLYLIATMFGSSAIRAHSYGLIRSPESSWLHIAMPMSNFSLMVL